MRPFLITSLVPMVYEAFCLPNRTAEYSSLEWAPQRCRNTVVSGLSFLVCGTRIVGSRYLRLFLLFAVYLSNTV